MVTFGNNQSRSKNLFLPWLKITIHYESVYLLNFLFQSSLFQIFFWRLYWICWSYWNRYYSKILSWSYQPDSMLLANFLYSSWNQKIKHWSTVLLEFNHLSLIFHVLTKNIFSTLYTGNHFSLSFFQRLMKPWTNTNCGNCINEINENN